MSMEQLTTVFEAGAAAYGIAYNSSGEVFDWATDTWVSPSLPPTTPYVAVTEIEDEAGADFSDYWAAFDLSRLNPGVRMDVKLKMFDQLGGSRNPATDDEMCVAALTIQAGEVFTSGQSFLECVFSPVYRPGEDTIYFEIGMRSNGAVVTFDEAATCALEIRQVAPTIGADLFVIAATALDANGAFTLSKLAPNLNSSSSVYRARITIVNDGATYEFEQLFPGYA